MKLIVKFILILIITSCVTKSKSKLSQKPLLELKLKVINLKDSNAATDSWSYCGLFYEIKNNSTNNVYFNKMNFSSITTDTSGREYKKGYFNILFEAERYTQGCQHCKLKIDFDIYPMNKKDTIINIIKIKSNSSYTDTLRAYGYDYLYDFTDKKDNLPFCYKKEGRRKIKFQLLYDNTLQDVRLDSIWKGKLLSNIAIWE